MRSAAGHGAEWGDELKFACCGKENSGTGHPYAPTSKHSVTLAAGSLTRQVRRDADCLRLNTNGQGRTSHWAPSLHDQHASPQSAPRCNAGQPTVTSLALTTPHLDGWVVRVAHVVKQDGDAAAVVAQHAVQRLVGGCGEVAQAGCGAAVSMLTWKPTDTNGMQLSCARCSRKPKAVAPRHSPECVAARMAATSSVSRSSAARSRRSAASTATSLAAPALYCGRQEITLSPGERCCCSRKPCAPARHSGMLPVHATCLPT